MTNILNGPSMNLTHALPQAQSQRENCLKSKVLQRHLHERFKGWHCQLMKDQGELTRRDTSVPFRPVPVEESVEIFIFADINGRVPYFISNGRPVPIYGNGMQFLLLKQMQEEICYLLLWKSTSFDLHHQTKTDYFAS